MYPVMIKHIHLIMHEIVLPYLFLVTISGARVIMACRDRARAEAARDEIVQDTGNENVVVRILNLGSLRSVKQFADEVNESKNVPIIAHQYRSNQ